MEKDQLSPRRFKRERSLADQSVSDVTSSHRSKTRRFKLNRRGVDSSSKLDISSNNSGFMSKHGKKIRGRKDGKGSVSMAIKNEAILNKLQEDFVAFKQYCYGEFTRVEKETTDKLTDLEARVNEKQEDLARNSVANLEDQMKEMQKMEESQNFVLKDCHEKTQSMMRRP